MMTAHNQLNSYFSWYQSKSIKESLKESELATLEAIQFSVNNDLIATKIIEVKKDIERYGAEKNEILIGSANLTQDKWVQDLNGEFGKIVGVQEWEERADRMDNATQKFDIAMLFFLI